MHLLQLPVELLPAIARNLDDESDISSLSRSSWSLFHALISHLYGNNYLHHSSSAVAWAIETGRLETIQRAINVGIDLVHRRHITLAAELGKPDLLKILLEAKLEYGGFESLDTDEDDHCPLLVATAVGQCDTVKILLDTGKVNIEARNLDGHTPLHISSRDGNHAMVKLLLEYGADTTALEEYGHTPLVFASAPDIHFSNRRKEVARENYLETARVLIQHGADVHYTESNGYSVLHTAVRFGYCDVVELLASHGADVNTRDQLGNTPLQTASLHIGKLEMSQLLVRLGADINTVNYQGRNSLYLTRGTAEPAQVAQFLLAQGVEMVTDLKGNTPLHHSRLAKSQDLVRILIANGADVDAVNQRGETPLHCVSSDPSCASLVRTLVERGAAVNLKDRQGQTPLFLAVRYSSLEAMKALLEHGADPDCKSVIGLSVIQMAVSRRSREQTDLLLRYGANLGAFDYEGRSAMQYCSLFGNVEMVELLFSYGVSIHEPDAEGYTPLMDAVQGGSIKVIDFLLEKGANVHAVNNRGQTALHKSASSHGTRLDIVKLLIKHGAHMDVADKEGRTPLSMFKSSSDDLLVDLIIRHGADASPLGDF